MSRNVVDSGALELVRAGLITYRQLNEVHRLIQETGGDLESILVQKGWVSADELSRRRGAPGGTRRLKLARSLDLVKAGLLSFKQLNECHRAAREAGGARSVLEIAIEKGFVTELQAATLPEGGPEQDTKSKRFSSSWDLFRAGMVSLKALNECHREIKTSPGKTLKEALLERGYVTREQLDDVEARKARGEAPAPSARGPSFRERWAEDLGSIPDGLRDELKRERVAREKPAPVRPAARSAPPAPAPRQEPPPNWTGATPAVARATLAAPPKPQPAAKPPAAKPPGAKPPSRREDEIRRSKTIIDLQADEEESDFRAAQTLFEAERPAAEEEEQEADDGVGHLELRSAKTFLDLDEAEQGELDLRSAKTFMDAEEADEGVDRSARTMVDDGPAPSDSGRTIMVMGDEPEGAHEEEADFRAAKTFMDAGDAGPVDDVELRSARTFLDASEADPAADDVELRSARTFLDPDYDSETAAYGRRDSAEVKPEGGGARTFMDMEDDFQAEQTNVDVAAGGRKKTFLDDSNYGQTDGQTFMDMGGAPPAPSKADATPVDAAEDASRTEYDAGEKTGQTESGSKSGDSKGTDTKGDLVVPSSSPDVKGGSTGGAGKAAPTEAAGGTSAGDSAGSSAGTGTSSGASGAGSSAGAGGSRTEAEAGDSRVKRHTKKKSLSDASVDDAYSHPFVGKVIGQCRIVKKLGEGGMGAVFLAEHTRLKRQTVIKVIPAHLASNKQLIARFTREAEAAAKIQHPNVVSVYNVGEENGVHYIEMEYVDGKGLDSLMKEKKVIEQMEAVRIIKECCKGLHEAHQHGIVHRDIKPDNVMMTRKGQVKLADFGLARAASTEQMELTRRGQILGTPAYMSPEQCQGKPTDLRCDIYSLGATFYAMITGKRPFTGASVMEIMQKHIDEEPISPRELNPDVSAAIAKVVLKMMAKKPEDRYQASEEVIAALDLFMREEGSERLAEVQAAIGGDYRLIKKLGQGGMGAVYSARAAISKGRVNAGAVVAIKVLTEGVDADEIERFRQEAELAQQIDHENIIRVLDLRISPQVNFIVMEYVEGESVRDLLRGQKALPEGEAIRIVKLAGQGLKRAHALGIIHRDIKPDNLMRGKDGQVKIADFGIAKHVEARTELTQAGFLVGTPHYMSPEQCSGKGLFKVGTQADIYSLGATLYYMVTGQKPFEGETQAAILLQHLQQPPAPPRELNPELSEGLENVILNMMAKKPTRRYGTIDEVLADLERVAQGQVPKKRKGIDVPLEETGKARRNALVIVSLTLVLGAYAVWATVTAERRAIESARAAVKQTWDETEAQVRAHAEAKQFANAAQALDGLQNAIDRVDSTDDKRFRAEYQDDEAALRQEVAKKKEARDAEAREAWSGLEKGPLVRAERELAMLEQRLALYRTWREGTPKSSLAERAQGVRTVLGDEGLRQLQALEAELRQARGTSGAATPAFEPRQHWAVSARDAVRQAVGALAEVDAERFGDAAQVGLASARRGDLIRRLSAHAAAAQAAFDEDLKARWIDQEFYVQALNKVEDQLESWKEPETSPLSFAALVEQLRQRDAELREKETKLGAREEGKVRRVRDLAFDIHYSLASGLKLARSAYDLDELLLELVETPELVPFNELLDRCEQLRDDPTLQTAEPFRHVAPIKNDLIGALIRARREQLRPHMEGVMEKVSSLAAAGSFAQALSQLDGAVARIEGSYRKKDAQELEAVSAELKTLRKTTLAQLRAEWLERQARIEELAWKRRDFRAADAQYREIMANKEFDVRFELEDGQTLAIRPEAAAARERLVPWLERLRGVKVARGTWTVGGGTTGYANEAPAHPVTLEVDVWLDRTEVTVGEYLEFLRTASQDGRPRAATGPGELAKKHIPGPFCHKDCPLTGHAPEYLVVRDAQGEVVDFAAGLVNGRPVVSVSFWDAWAFARWAGKRLPSEREWEIAASSRPDGKRTSYPWGDEWVDRQMDELVVRSEKHDERWDPASLPLAGSLPRGASGCGALDMAGSVWEWCDAGYDAYPGQSRDVDPDFGQGFRVIRGGSFTDYYKDSFRCSFRNRARPDERRANLGFRCAWDPEQ